MDMLCRIECDFTRFQFKRLTMFRLEHKRSLQHVNRLIAWMVMLGCDSARRNVGDKDDNLFPLHA